MKLIHCLLEVLPSQGGWKYEADFVAVSFGEAKFYSEKHGWLSTIDGVVDVMEGDKVNREEYELALAKANQPVWNGEGLPPAGMKIEWLSEKYGWIGGTVAAHDAKYPQVAIIRHNDGYAGCHRHEIRTIEERKRENTVDLIMGWMHHAGRTEIELIYDAIAAGKIPHINLK